MDAYEWLRRAAEGKALPDDPLYDCSVDIMDCVTRNLQQGVETYDGQHITDIEGILRRLIISFSDKHAMTPAIDDTPEDTAYMNGFNDALKVVDAHFAIQEPEDTD